LVFILVNGKKFNIKGGTKKNYSHKKYLKNTSLNTKTTYRLFGDYKYYQYLREHLNKLGWKEVHSGNYVDFAYISPHPCMLTNKSHNRKEFKFTHSNLKSTLANIESLGHKDSLSILMKGSPYIPYTKNIKNYIYKDGDVVIIKKVLSSKQEGIYIVVDKDTFLKMRNKLANEKAIVSKYIKNPLLFQGKKFHFRIMVSVIVTASARKILYNKDNILIVMAKNKYNISVKEDYLDPDMNLSRGDSTKKMYIWPTDFQKIEHADEIFIKKCNKSIHDALNSIPLDKLSLYPDQKAGFYTYGADIMLDDTGHAYILEMNMDPGLGIELLEAMEINKVDKKEIKQNYLKYFKDFKKNIDPIYKFHLDKIILPYFTINVDSKIYIQKTYKIFTGKEYYPRENYSYLIDKLNSLGWVEKPHETKYVDFAFSLINNNFIEADLKYSLDGIKTIGNKRILAESMKNSKHIPPSEDLKTYKWFNDIVIVKEVFSNQQLGVYIIVDEDEFIKLKERLLSEHKDAMVSKYIKNPLLFQGKKFHLRAMVCVFVKRNNKKLIKKIFYIKELTTIKTAKEKYIIKNKEDYLDRDKNITGGFTTDGLNKWPHDFQKYENLSSQFIQKCEKSIHDAVNDIPLNGLSLYPAEQNAGLFIFGADILLDDTGNAWILELNTKPGLIGKEVKNYKDKKLKKKYIANYFATLLKFLLDNIILPYFYSNIKN